MLNDVFALPVENQFLVYAPLHHIAALVDRAAVRSLSLGFDPPVAPTGPMAEILDILQSGERVAPAPRQGSLEPLFLGLIPTRSCNLACAYCGFVPAGNGQRAMEPPVVRAALDWYLSLGLERAEVHFFGGEPLCAAEVMDLAVHYARLKAAEVGCRVSFEVSTNGVMDEERCRWLAESMDTVVLSLDGPADIQDRQRAHAGGRGSFETVARSARILAEGSAELCVRMCVTSDTVGRMPDSAAWLCREFRPDSVCFEPVQPTARSEAAGLAPPDPWQFARGYLAAADVLDAFGVEAVYAAADVSALHASFCPVGRDAVMVSPDGALSACYLLPQEWESRGLDLALGRVRDGRVELDQAAVDNARRLTVWNKPGCQACFCRWHCAGGCHVNHVPPGRPGDYTRLCVQARAIGLGNLLRALGQGARLAGLFERQALIQTVGQPTDRLEDVARGL